MAKPTLSEQLQQINALKAVKKAAFAYDNDKQVFFIQLQPVIVRCRSGKYRLPSLKFKFTHTGFDLFKCSVLNRRIYTHPHISRGEKEPCWGQASIAMREAVGRGDWITFTHALIRWAATVDLEDSYMKPVFWKWRPFRKLGYMGKNKPLPTVIVPPERTADELVTPEPAPTKTNNYEYW